MTDLENIDIRLEANHIRLYITNSNDIVLAIMDHDDAGALARMRAGHVSSPPETTEDIMQRGASPFSTALAKCLCYDSILQNLVSSVLSPSTRQALIDAQPQLYEEFIELCGSCPPDRGFDPRLRLSEVHYALVFALVAYVSDGYLSAQAPIPVVNSEPWISSSNYTKGAAAPQPPLQQFTIRENNARRFFNIVDKLPMDMQLAVVEKTVHNNVAMDKQAFDPALKLLLPDPK